MDLSEDGEDLADDMLSPVSGPFSDLPEDDDEYEYALFCIGLQKNTTSSVEQPKQPQASTPKSTTSNLRASTVPGRKRKYKRALKPIDRNQSIQHLSDSDDGESSDDIHNKRLRLNEKENIGSAGSRDPKANDNNQTTDRQLSQHDNVIRTDNLNSSRQGNSAKDSHLNSPAQQNEIEIGAKNRDEARTQSTPIRNQSQIVIISDSDDDSDSVMTSSSSEPEKLIFNQE